MNLAWGGMSKAKCLERAKEVNSGSGQCGYVSYSSSAGPQGRTDFCQCHRQADCADPLEQPQGESWETFPTVEPTPPIESVTLAEGQRSGRCYGPSYMNLAWGGMSKAKCLERAYEVNRAPGPAGQCGYVSYSSSAGPQQRSDFCRCHQQADCADPLEQPRGESWETFLTHEPKSHMVVILACLAAVAVLLLICLAVYLYRRHKPKTAQAASAGAAPGYVEQGLATEVSVSAGNVGNNVSPV